MRAKLIIGLLRVFARLPLRLSHAIGAFFGWVMFYLPNKSRKVARTNIAICFPELSSEEQTALLKQSLRETAKTFAEMGAMWFWPNDKLLDLAQEVEGEEYFHQAKQNGKGLVVLTPHIGQWEFLGLFFTRYMPMSSMYRPMRIQDLEETIINARERTGSRLQPANAKGVKGVFAALKRAEMVGILPDQNPTNAESGVYAPFFGRPALSMVLVSKIAMKFDMPVVMTYAERLPKGKGFRVVVRPVSDKIHDKPLQESVAVMNQAIENCVREIPTQYQWVYKRFKHQPEGFTNPY